MFTPKDANTTEMTKGDGSDGMLLAFLCIVGMYIIIVYSPILFGDKCGDSDATQACLGNYGVCMDGSTCMVACQNMSNTLNRSVYCECPCETCKTPHCFRVNLIPKEMN